jgi:hypothetical protein
LEKEAPEDKDSSVLPAVETGGKRNYCLDNEAELVTLIEFAPLEERDCKERTDLLRRSSLLNLNL